MIQIHCKYTNLDHRYVLYQAIDNYHEINPKKNINIYVGTREIIRVILKILIFSSRNDSPVIFYFTGFGRLFTDYWFFGKVAFLFLIRLCSIIKNTTFIVENITDKLLIERLSNKKTYVVNGSGFFEKIVNNEGLCQVNKKSKELSKIVYLSRFGKSKHSDKIVKLARSLPKDVQLIIGGYDIRGKKYSNIFREISTNHPNIKFLGKIEERKRYYRILKDSDILIYPSKREGCPFGVLESLAANTLPIVANTPGCSNLANKIGTPILNPKDFMNYKVLANTYLRFFKKAESGEVKIPNVELYSADNVREKFVSIFDSV